MWFRFTNTYTKLEESVWVLDQPLWESCDVRVAANPLSWKSDENVMFLRWVVYSSRRVMKNSRTGIRTWPRKVMKKWWKRDEKVKSDGNVLKKWWKCDAPPLYLHSTWGLTFAPGEVVYSSRKVMKKWRVEPVSSDITFSSHFFSDITFFSQKWWKSVENVTKKWRGEKKWWKRAEKSF